MTPRTRWWPAAGALAVCLTSSLQAQHQHADSTRQHADSTPRRAAASMPERPFGIPMTRMGSGTAWLPDASAMRAWHFGAGGWMLMLHGDAFIQYDHQGGPRGA